MTDVRIKKPRPRTKPKPPGESKTNAELRPEPLVGEVLDPVEVEPEVVEQINPPNGYFKYRAEYADQARAMCKLGATQTDLADFFGVTTATVDHWRSYYPRFDDALKVGKDEFDDRVERALAARAVGYSYDAVKIFMIKNKVVEKDGEGKVIGEREVPEPVMVRYREHVPPSETACIFWLKNRRPEKWRDVINHKHGGDVAITITELESKLC